MPRDKSITIHLDGGNLHGDLHVTGFGSDHTALRLGAAMADGIRASYPGALVTITIDEPADATGETS